MDQNRNEPSRSSRDVGTVRRSSSTLGLSHRASGPALCLAIIPASYTSTHASSARHHLLHHMSRSWRHGANTCSLVFSCTGDSHDTTDSLRHSRACVECRKLSVVSCISPVQENTQLKVLTSCSSLTTTSREQHRVMHREPVGRAGREPDGGRVRHDGPAWPCAGLRPQSPQRTRESEIFGLCI